MKSLNLLAANTVKPVSIRPNHSFACLLEKSDIQGDYPHHDIADFVKVDFKPESAETLFEWDRFKTGQFFVQFDLIKQTYTIIHASRYSVEKWFKKITSFNDQARRYSYRHCYYFYHPGEFASLKCDMRNCVKRKDVLTPNDLYTERFA